MSVLIDRDDLLERIKAIPIYSGMVKARILETVRNAPTVGEDTNATGWISVKDRLPEKHVEVIINVSFGFVSTAWLESWGWNDCAGGWSNDDVTHWMPLPEPPKEADDD